MSENRKDMNRPDYADFDAPHKFNAIISIIGRRLKEHPNAICSYSGGSDSDIMLDLIEKARAMFDLPPIHYVFINTGLEMAATRRHVAEVAEKYGVTIDTVRPKKGIVRAVRDRGAPIFSKALSEILGRMQKHNIPIDIADEFEAADDKQAKLTELYDRFPNAKSVVRCICSCDNSGVPCVSQSSLSCIKYLKDYMQDNPIPFTVSKDCCDICKKRIAHDIANGYEMVITGERKSEGGLRASGDHVNAGCFAETNNGKFRLRPIYYVSDADKAWYKERYNIRYSDAYEVYGLTRTGCCGCSINSNAANDLEKIRPYEPNLVKAAWNVFGASYRYRAQYDEYKAERMAREKAEKKAAAQAKKCECDLLSLIDNGDQT